MNINICNEYTDTPGGRYKEQGPYSGEEFREKILKRAYFVAKDKREKLIIDLDGGFGYGSSFLEEAFGGLIRELEPEQYKDIFDIIEIKSDDEPTLIADIRRYIQNAIDENKRKKKNEK